MSVSAYVRSYVYFVLTVVTRRHHCVLSLELFSLLV